MAAQGTQLTNKYAEGYPANANATTGGCEYADIAEQLATPCGSNRLEPMRLTYNPTAASANEAVFLAFLKPGDHQGHEPWPKVVT